MNPAPPVTRKFMAQSCGAKFRVPSSKFEGEIGPGYSSLELRHQVCLVNSQDPFYRLLCALRVSAVSFFTAEARRPQRGVAVGAFSERATKKNPSLKKALMNWRWVPRGAS